MEQTTSRYIFLLAVRASWQFEIELNRFVSTVIETMTSLAL